MSQTLTILLTCLFVLYQLIPYATTSLEKCSHHTGLPQLTTQGNKVFNAINSDSTMHIQFDIKLHEYCSSTICNILFLTNANNTRYCDLTINGIQNDFQISTHNSNRTISNANHLLTVDNIFHTISLLITETELLFKIQNTSHIYHIRSILDNDTYSMYFSNPWNYPINASVSNICVSKSNNATTDIGLNVECGDKLIGELLSEADLEILTFTLPFFANVVLFDTCSSKYDTTLFFYTNNNLTHFADDDGHCGYQAQLLIENLPRDKYHLVIMGYGTLEQHDYGIWHLDIICRNNDQLIGIETAITCNHTISETYVLSVGSNYYHLIPANDSESILIETCRSSYDTQMVIYDMNFTQLLNPSDCLLFAPTKSDEYILGVYSVNNEHNFPHELNLNTLCIKNTSVTSVTNTTTTEQCAYSLNRTYSMNVDIPPIIIDIHPNIQINFKLKLNEYCISSCNIVSISNANNTENMILSLETSNNALQILTKSYDVIDSYSIENIKQILPEDEKFHSITVSINELNIKIIIDDVSYFHRFAFTFASSFYFSTIYFSGYESKLNATISNICIQQAPLNSFIQCGDKLHGELSHFNSTEEFIFELTFDANFVLVDSCGTSFDSVLVMFNIWDGNLIDWNDNMYCLDNAQLLIHNMVADWYYLAIVSYSNSDVLKYHIDILCGNDEQLFGTDGDITCNVDIDKTSTSDLDFFYFHMYTQPMTWTMTIDLCKSSYAVAMVVYDLNFDIFFVPFINESEPINYCSFSVDPDPLIPAELILAVVVVDIGQMSPQGYNNLHVSWSCTNVFLDNYVAPILLDYPTVQDIGSTSYGLSFRDAQMMCELQFGTTLATITTNSDLSEVYGALRKGLTRQSVSVRNKFKNNNLTAYIGLYTQNQDECEWKWIDGTFCNHTLKSYCMDNITWEEGEDCGNSIKSSLTTAEQAVAVSTTSTIFQFAAVPDLDAPNVGAFVCNGINGKYAIEQCNDMVNCWHHLNCCNDLSFNFPIFNLWGSINFWYLKSLLIMVVWNSTLFVDGIGSIHYTNIDDLSNNKYQWKHLKYDTSFRNWTMGEKYTQYESSLYIYSLNILQFNDTLTHINLDTLEVNVQEVKRRYSWNKLLIYINNPTTSLTERFCIVADENYIYFFGYDIVQIYTIKTNIWEVLEFIDMQVSTCSITNDHRFIFIFGEQLGFIRTGLIFKFDTKLKAAYRLKTPSLCLPPWFARNIQSITAPNDKMYIHGCGVASWKTLIFDTNQQEFDELETIDIDVPIAQNLPDYRYFSFLSVYDDNVLLLLHSLDDRYPAYSWQVYNPQDISELKPFTTSLYFAVTNEVSINFKKSITMNVWPSDGFSIKYSVNNFRADSKSDNTYYVEFSTNDTINNIQTFLIFDSILDKCICHERHYKCDGCLQHFDLKKYLSVEDNDLFQISFHTST
eukprot:256437_1